MTLATTQEALVQDLRHMLHRPYVARSWGWSLEEYLRHAPESRRWEFVRGEVLMYSPASVEHQDRVWFLAYLLFSWMQARAWPGKLLLAPAAVRLAEDVVREPDLSVFGPEDAPRVTGSPVAVRPLLVVEVTSPSTRRIDLEDKAEEYAQAGVPEYWVVDLVAGQFVGHVLEGRAYRRTALREGRWHSRVLPDFWLEVGWLFRPSLPSVQECLKAILA